MPAPPISGLVIEPGGEMYDVELSDYTDYDRLVGGYYECPPMRGNRFGLFCNEEGKIINLEPNLLATAVWHAFFDTDDIIHGTVVVTGGMDEIGNFTSLNKEDRDKLVACAAEPGGDSAVTLFLQREFTRDISEPGDTPVAVRGLKGSGIPLDPDGGDDE